jgi:3-oxoacyl-[acyl-carrier-protein] synthase II
MELKRVVVTGLGALTPLGKTTEELWNGLINGVSDAKDYFDRKEARKYDPYAQYGIISAMEAIKDSELDLDKFDHDRGGVIWASGIGGLNTFTEEISQFAISGGTYRFNPFFIPKMIADIAAGHISIKYGFMTPII